MRISVIGCGYLGAVHASAMAELGHEVVGIVERIGANAAKRWGVKEGDRIILEEPLPCGTCDWCLAGHYQGCDAPRYGAKSTKDAPSLWGGYSEYMYLDPRALVHKMSPSVPLEIAPLFVPISNGIYWAQEIGGAERPLHECPVGIGHQGVASGDIQRAHPPLGAEFQHGVEIRARFRRDFGAPGPFERCARRIVGDRAQPRQRRRQNPHIPCSHLVGTVEEELHCRPLAEQAENLQQVAELLQCRARFVQSQEVRADEHGNGPAFQERGSQTVRPVTVGGCSRPGSRADACKNVIW